MPRHLPATLRLPGCLTVIALLLASAPCRAEGWKRTGVEDGVTLETREIPGSPMPEFRGTAVMNADLYEIAAILDDLNRFCEWNARCVKTREYLRTSDTDRVFYTRTGAPWPLSDRDVVLHGTVTGLAEGEEVVVRFAGIEDPRWPAVDGCVRMPLVKGLWRMTRLPDGNTRVEYQVQADPGGIVPGWAARLSAKQVPRDTLTGLRRHLLKVRGRYQTYLDKWRRPPAPAQPPAAPAPSPPPARAP